MTQTVIKKKYIETKEIATQQYEYIDKLESILNAQGFSEKKISTLRSEFFSDCEKEFEEFKVSKRLKIEDIMDAVSLFYEVDTKHIFSTKRNRPYSRPRQIICYIAKFHIPEITLKDIGRYLGNRDHSTIIHAVQSVSDELSYSKSLQSDVNQILNTLKL